MANFNYNKVILAGRLCQDPELKATPTGISVLQISLAVRRSYAAEGKEAESDFISLVAWRKTAEFITRYFHKGSSICVTGTLQTRTWQDQNGQKRYATEVVVDEATFVDSRNENDRRQELPESSYGNPGYAKEAAPRFEELKSDDDLPF